LIGLLPAQLLHLLLRLFSQATPKDYASITQIWLQLSDVTEGSKLAAQTLRSLAREDNALEAYQVGFDLAEGGGQEFLKKVEESLGDDNSVSTLRLVT
jgi:hypothetical protein